MVGSHSLLAFIQLLLYKYFSKYPYCCTVHFVELL